MKEIEVERVRKSDFVAAYFSLYPYSTGETSEDDDKSGQLVIWARNEVAGFHLANAQVKEKWEGRFHVCVFV